MLQGQSAAAGVTKEPNQIADSDSEKMALALKDNRPRRSKFLMGSLVGWF